MALRAGLAGIDHDAEQLTGVNDLGSLVGSWEVLFVLGHDVVSLCGNGALINPVVVFVARDLQLASGSHNYSRSPQDAVNARNSTLVEVLQLKSGS